MWDWLYTHPHCKENWLLLKRANVAVCHLHITMNKELHFWALICRMHNLLSISSSVTAFLSQLFLLLQAQLLQMQQNALFSLNTKWPKNIQDSKHLEEQKKKNKWREREKDESLTAGCSTLIPLLNLVIGKFNKCVVLFCKEKERNCK